MLEKKSTTVLESASYSAQNFESRFSSYFFDEGRFSNKNYNYFFFSPEKKMKKKIENRDSKFCWEFDAASKTVLVFLLAFMVFDFYSFENYFKIIPQGT